jgi:hypothetical protein
MPVLLSVKRGRLPGRRCGRTIYVIGQAAVYNDDGAMLRRGLPTWSQMWKLSPQPQRPFSFGLLNVNPLVRAFVS